MSAGLSLLSPNALIVVLTLGFCLIFVELNRPGWILPGALGVLCLLLASAPLLERPLRPWAIALLVLAACSLLINLWRVLPPWLLVVATVCLVLGFRFAVRGDASHPLPVSLVVALFSGGILGGTGALLSRIALRARRAKAVH